ncbi:Sir2 family histone deacetylase Hst2 [Flagelloscypha sp. PMI_526]|nr:Sir2 family histone deacetylase Hst2 [Flagelloscypha sp. PMI_526]
MPFLRKKDSKQSSRILKDNDLPSLVKYIQSEKCKSIVVMLGAGVSTSAGIPDFRSPDTGLYANLARLKLPYPEAVFEINFFRKNPVPFYTLAQELYPGKFRPTITHSFIRLLSKKGLLQKCFTQNIDTLERVAGVPGDKVIEAHGSFAHQRCIECKVEFDDVEMKRLVLAKQVPKCKECGGLVKPDIVFFGESLPEEFIKAIPSIQNADLMIVMGTSLTVHPFASLAFYATDDCPRVLVNLDKVGDFGSRGDDVLLLGKCDDIVIELAQALGWEKELRNLWDQTALPEGSEEAGTTTADPATDVAEEVEKLTQKIGQALELNEDLSGKLKAKQQSTSESEEDVLKCVEDYHV